VVLFCLFSLAAPYPSFELEGCAVAFLFIVMILIIAICRVRMKRSSLVARSPGARSGFTHAGNRAAHRHHHGLQNMPLYDVDILLNHTSYPPASSVSPWSGSLVTLNINNGVQFVGRPVDPPPYCEVVSTPPRDGPPPPYASLENVAYANPEARLVAHDGVEPSERDSLLSSAREVVALEDADLRGNAECLGTLAPSMLNAGRVSLSSQQPMQEVDINSQVGSAVSLTVNSDMSRLNIISSSENGETGGELIVENGVDVNSCENSVILQKAPDIGVTDKSSANMSDVYDQDDSAPVSKICCSTQNENNFIVFCNSQEDPLQCLHDTFIDISASAGEFNPLVVVTASDMARVKGVDTAAPIVTLGNNTRTQVNQGED
jgi:hypothetical protein